MCLQMITAVANQYGVAVWNGVDQSLPAHPDLLTLEHRFYAHRSILEDQKLEISILFQFLTMFYALQSTSQVLRESSNLIAHLGYVYPHYNSQRYTRQQLLHDAT